MNFYRCLFIASAVLVVAAAVGAGACSSSVAVATPTVGVEPMTGVAFPDGYVVGSHCSGEDYVKATTGAGWLFCDGSAWAYTAGDPSDDGYSMDTAVASSDAEEDSGCGPGSACLESSSSGGADGECYTLPDGGEYCCDGAEQPCKGDLPDGGA